MATILRCADLNDDAQLIIEFLARNHTRESTQARFDWLYRKGPAGEAQVWLCVDSETQALVGVAAAFPRRMIAFGKAELGWVLGDFCIEPQYRSLGPALQLQRACLTQLDGAQPAIYYDFPSATMVAVYQRLRVPLSAPMVRMVKLLRAERKLERLIPQPQLVRIASSVINAGLAVRRSRFRLQSGWAVCAHQGPCGNEFTQLVKQVSPAAISLERSAEYLNWRYLRHPYRCHEILTLRRAGCLLAGAVVRQEDDSLALVDVFGYRDAVEELLQQIIIMAADRKLDAVTTEVSGAPDCINRFRRLGFYPREDFPVVTCYRNAEAAPANGAHWLLMKGDRES